MLPSGDLACNTLGHLVATVAEPGRTFEDKAVNIGEARASACWSEDENSEFRGAMSKALDELEK